MDDKELRDLVEHLNHELNEKAATGNKRVIRVRRYFRHEAVRVAHEIGLASAGVIAADHYVVPFVIHLHLLPALVG